MKNTPTNSELNLEKLFKTISNYKLLILFFILLSSFLMFLNLYFQPSFYNSSAIVEIKSKNKPNIANDLLSSALSFGGSGKTESEIAILQTFLIHKKALEKINFKTSYYENNNYRDIEIYNNTPIAISNIQIKDINIINKKFILTPKKEGYTLTLDKNPIASLFTSNNESKIYPYNKIIENEYFKLKITQNSILKKSIKFILNGDNRKIYDEMINKRFTITKINPNAPLVKISFEDNIPQRANNYINAITSSFIEQSIESKNEQNSKILDFINKELDSMRNTLKLSENKLENFKVTNKILEPSMQAKIYINKLSQIEVDISENSLKEKLIENLLTFANHNNNLDAIAPSLMELNDRPTLQLISSLQNLQINENELKTEFTDQYPKLITVRRQIDHTRNKILSNMKNLKSLTKQKTLSLLTKKKTYEKKIQHLPKKEKKLVNIKRDYQVSSTMYNYLLKKRTEIELLVVSTLSDYKVIDKAHTITDPIKPKRTLMMIVAPVIGLILGIILAIILDTLNKKIKTKEELEALTDLPIYGIVPELSKKDVKLEVCTNPNSIFTESYRNLRNHLQSKKEDGTATIITITSSIANEGKTTLTSNLACVFQMAGYKSIILSLDLRKPILHSYFNLTNDKGMSSYLAGKDSIQDIIFATKHTDLHVITSGPITNNPSELILSKRLPELLEILKTRYDYIFIDTAPVGLVSDTLQLMKIADKNLVVFRENYAESSFINSLNDIADKNKLENIGLVLNRSKSQHNAYGYGAYGYGGGR
jgi:capsular exopolysaccharide synthesis family protein